jgi:hypothetical protein
MRTAQFALRNSQMPLGGPIGDVGIAARNTIVMVGAAASDDLPVRGFVK